MTAIGIILFIVSSFIAWLDDYIDVPEWLKDVTGVVWIIGIIMLFIGSITWIWKVMP